VSVLVFGLSATPADAGWFDSLMKSERADLRLESFSLNKSKAAVGDNLIATVEVSNWGNLKAKSARLTFLAAPGATSSLGQATRVYSMDLGSMRSKSRLRYTATFAVPTWAKTGPYQFFATVESRTTESKRGNNTVATTLDVTGSAPAAAPSSSSSVASVSAPSAPNSSPPAVAPSPPPTSGVSCDYYASSTGTATNDGLSTQRPFRPQEFWALARPGTTLCLMDGVYRGSAYMLAPSSQGGKQPQGTSSAPITIRALNDGKVLINGGGSNRPVAFGNPGKWWIVEGINACCSSGSVVSTGDSEDFAVRRVIAWDAADIPDVTDTLIYEPAYSVRGLFEDVAGWGRGRKIMQPQLANGITVRRAYFRHTGYTSKKSGPRTTFELDYNSPNTLVENVISTWTEEASDNPGDHEATSFRMGHPNGGHGRIYGSFGYVKCSALQVPNQLIAAYGLGGGTYTIQDTVAMVEPGCFPTKLNMRLENQTGSNFATRLSTWGGAGNTISSTWQQSGVGHSTTYPGTLSNPFSPTGTNARLCHRYVNGELTNTPLWPWPMDARIKAALATSGYTGMDGDEGTVTSEVESLLGSISAGCRADGLGG
jgi:hypothetical protein